MRMKEDGGSGGRVNLVVDVMVYVLCYVVMEVQIR